MKRKVRIILLLVIGLAAVVVGVFWIVSGSGSSRLEGWIGTQLQEITNARINPRLSFSDLHYAYPATVSVQHLRLVADDPAEPGRTVDIVAADRATITLAKVPRVGEPIAIERIVLDKPLFSAVSVAPRSGKLIGFSDFVRQPSSQPTTKPRTRLSDVLAIRLIQINDGRIVYDPRIRGTEPMELDQINTKLDIEPTEAGWYKLKTAIQRHPVFDISAAGQLNLDNFTARDVAIKLLADLSAGNLNYLPPQLQKFLNRYQVRGVMSGLLLGDVPMTRPREASLNMDVSLSDSNVTLGEYQIPVDKLDLSMRLEDGELSFPSAKASALHGTAQLSGSIALDPVRRDAKLDLKIMGMLFQDLLAAKKEGEPPRLAGKVDAEAQIDAPLRILRHTIQGRVAGELPENWGSGTLQLTEGRLLKVPVFQKISDTIHAAARMVGAASNEVPSNDRLKLAVTGAGDQIDFEEITYVSHYIAARGKGSMTLADHKLDQTFNAGPIEKMQQMLGEQIGGAIATVTDKVVRYRVTGTFKDPQVNVEVAGGAMDGVGKTIGKIGEEIGNVVNPQK